MTVYRRSDPLQLLEDPDLLDVAPAAIAWWMVLTAAVVVVLVGVLVLLGIGQVRGGTRV